MELIIPKDEMLWVQYMENAAIKYIITSNIYRTEYYLYKVADNKPKKTKYQSDNPLDLERYVKLNNKP